MRKLLREAKADPKVLKDAATDRPRAGFWTVRDAVDYRMADAILFLIRHGT